MHEAYQKRFQRLQNLMDQFDQSFRGLTYVQLNQKRTEASWSIAEIVYHISRAEIAITQYIQKKLNNSADVKKAGLKSLYRATLLRLALRSSRKFRAPKQLDEPHGPYEIEKLMEEWRAVRQQLSETIQQVPQTHIKHELFKHPVVGKINLVQTLSFMGDHMERHLEQIEGIKHSLK